MTCTCFRVGSIYVRIHPLSVLSVLTFMLTENSVYAVSVVLCVALHEAGHVIALYRCGGKPLSFSFLPCGLEIGMSTLSYKKEIAVAAAGPFANFVFYLLFSLLASRGAFFLFCAECNLFLAVFNLLPLCDFDGARILKNLSFLFLPYRKALALQRIADSVCYALFFALCVAACRRSGFNLSLCVILFYLLCRMLCRSV